MDFAARYSERGVVTPHGLGIRRIEKAIHLAVGVVKKLHLTNSKLIRFVILGVLSDLCDGLVRQFKVVVVIHELRHVPPFVGVVRNSSLAVLLAENTPILCSTQSTN